VYVKSLGAEVRLHRARVMVERLTALQEEYLRSGAVRLEVAHGPESSWRVRIDSGLPVELTELVTSCLRLTRDALDDLAASLVIASRRTPRHTSFPIAVSAHDYPAEQTRCLRGANERARHAVRSVTPWKGADDLLWELRLLDEPRGHTPVIHLGQLLPPTPVRVPVALQVLQTAAAPVRGTRHPLADHSLLVVSDPATSEPDQARLLESSIFPVLGEGHLALGQPVLEILTRLVDHASTVAERVVRALDHP
jgi:hypothetical protein